MFLFLLAVLWKTLSNFVMYALGWVLIYLSFSCLHSVEHHLIAVFFSVNLEIWINLNINVQAFHVFHTSCLIHWILLCEIEIITNQSDAPIVRRRTRRKTAAKCNEVQKDGEMALRTPICSVICPECQGTGRIVEGDELEKPTVPLSKVCNLQDDFL